MVKPSAAKSPIISTSMDTSSVIKDYIPKTPEGGNRPPVMMPPTPRKKRTHGSRGNRYTRTTKNSTWVTQIVNNANRRVSRRLFPTRENVADTVKRMQHQMNMYNKLAGYVTIATEENSELRLRCFQDMYGVMNDIMDQYINLQEKIVKRILITHEEPESDLSSESGSESELESDLE